MKNLNNLRITPFTNDEVLKLIRLYQFKGKDFFYETLMKSDLEGIMGLTIENECNDFIKFYDIKLTDNRRNLIVRKDATPKTKDEKLITNLKQVLSRFVGDPLRFELITNDIYSMMKMLYAGVDSVSFTSKVVNLQMNLLTEKKKVSSRNDLEDILKRYESLTNSRKYEVTYLIVNFYIDFIHMNIFNRGNDIAGLLLIYAFLLREGFSLFRYVDFFGLLLKHKEEFNNAVLQADYNYAEGFSKSAPLHMLLIDILIEGYEMVESKLHEYSFDKNVNKTDDIENTIYRLGEIFTKDDIRERHPLTSESTINRTLNRLKNENIIRPNGVGRSATWIRLVDRERFNPDVKQINLFEAIDSADEDFEADSNDNE